MAGRIKRTISFHGETHTYKIDGRVVPSVTEVLADLYPGWAASEWYLQRGRAVHACAAMIAQGLDFDHDERIAGQVEACRKFWATMEYFPEVVEGRLFSVRYQYGGTVDLVVRESGAFLVIDYKASLTDVVPIQLAAYALAVPENYPAIRKISYGMAVELRADGTYKCSEIYSLRRYTAEWLASLSVFNVRRRLGITQELEPGKETEDE